MSIRTLLPVVLAAALALPSLEAAAQLGGGFPGGGGMGRRGGMRGNTDPNRAQRPPQAAPSADVFQTTLEELRQDLKLSEAQEAGWNAYVAKLSSLMGDAARERNRSRQPPERLTVPQQLDRMAMAAQNRATAIEDVTSAAKALYGMLSAEQKVVADARLAHVTSLALDSGAGERRP